MPPVAASDAMEQRRSSLQRRMSALPPIADPRRSSVPGVWPASPGAGSVHGVVDEQDYNDGTQHNHPIGNLSASYRCFSLKPFHDLHPRLGFWRTVSDTNTYETVTCSGCNRAHPLSRWGAGACPNHFQFSPFVRRLPSAAVP